MRSSRAITVGVSAAFLVVAFVSPGAQVRNTVPGAPSGPEELDVVRLRPHFYVIAGAGGNIAVQTGADGVVVVDSGRADAAARVLAAIQKATDQRISFIINTSAHSDHVGGNAQLAKAGLSIFAQGGGLTAQEPAPIFAFEKILLRMSAPTGQASPFPVEAWPTDTFSERRKDLYFNQEGIQIYHEPAAHSDADSVVFFRASDVVVAGEIIDTTRFPVIDLARGGSIQGEINALNHVIDLSVRPLPLVFQGGGTYIVPGRGRVYDKLDVVEYRDMVVIIRDMIQDMIKRGMTLAQIKAAAPAKAYERQYGASSGPWTTDNFVDAVYQGLTARK